MDVELPAMVRLGLVIGVLALGPAVSQALEPQMVEVGYVANPADFTGRGAVEYRYSIGRFEITVAEYVEYLNAVYPSATNGSHLEAPPGTSINNQAPQGSRYSAMPGWGNKPITGVGWTHAARFVNWLEIGQPHGPGALEAATVGTYDLSTQPLDPARRAGAQWALPSINEWYKAAFFDPVSTGADADVGDAVGLPSSPNYWLYPTRSDTVPIKATCDVNGNATNPGSNTANWGSGCPSGSFNGLSNVGSTAAVSFFGALDLAGNVYELLDNGVVTGTVGPTGGSWAHTDPTSMRATRNPILSAGPPEVIGSASNGGFRIVFVSNDVPGICERGDLNADGVIDLVDSAVLRRFLVGLGPGISVCPEDP